METKDYLSYIVHEIHTTIVATVDDEGLPVTLCYRTGSLPALRELHGGVPGRCGGKKVIT